MQYETVHDFILHELMNPNNPRSRDLLQLHCKSTFGFGADVLGLTEMARHWGVTRTRVLQIRNSAIRMGKNKANALLDSSRAKYIIKEVTPEVMAETRKYPCTELSLDSINLNVRARNCLRNEGLYTVDDLVRYLESNGENRLLKTPNFGRKSLSIVLAALEQVGHPKTWK